MPLRPTSALLLVLALPALSCNTHVVHIDCNRNPLSAGCTSADAATPSTSEDDGGRGGQGGSASGAGGSSAGRGGSSTAGSDAGAGTGGTGEAGSTAGSGGTSGTGGSSAGECASDLECAADQPQCNSDQQCGACTSDDACEDRTDTTRCNLASGSTQGQCVQCLDPSDCTDPAKPRCVSNACAECSMHSDCTDPARPQCTAGACAPCDDDAACTARPQGTHCMKNPGTITSGTCVTCIDNSHCENPTPECNADHTCVPCTGNGACTDRPGKTVCDLSADATFTGQCVQCTGTQYADCGTNATSGDPLVCSSLTRQCSQEPLHGRGLCESCSSDVACALGQACVRQTFKGNELGYVCLWVVGSAQGGAPAACASARPYVGRRDDIDSIDGLDVDVCGLRATTCEGLSAFSSTACASDDACGLAGQNDGVCGVLEAGTNRCTLPCTSSDDCRPDYACNTTAGTPSCDLQPNRCYGASDCPPEKPVCNTIDKVCQVN
jgi:hypothetical protein